jgi:hypothetical protein
MQAIIAPGKKHADGKAQPTAYTPAAAHRHIHLLRRRSQPVTIA